MENISFYYDNIINGNPAPNACIDFNITKDKHQIPYITDDVFYNDSCTHRVTMLYNTLKYIGIQPNIVTGKQRIKNCYYPIELSFHGGKPISRYVSEKTVYLTKKNRFKILLTYQEEGAAIQTIALVKKQADELVHMGVPKSNIVVLLGDINCAYKKFLDPYKLFGLDWWQIKHQITYKSRAGENLLWTSLRNYDKPVLKKERKKLLNNLDTWQPQNVALSYNGNNRIHRAGLVSELLLRNLQEKSYISYNVYDQPCSQFSTNDNRVVDLSKSNAYLKEKLKWMEYVQNARLIIDKQDGDVYKDDRYHNIEHYANSLVSLVTETYATDIIDKGEYEYHDEINVLWTTEKTWKPIQIGHPFIILGSQDTITYLNNEGYFSFPEFWSESYDRVAKLSSRIDMICDQIDRLDKMTIGQRVDMAKKIKPFLESNRNRFLNKDNRPKVIKLYKEMQYG